MGKKFNSSKPTQSFFWQKFKSVLPTHLVTYYSPIISGVVGLVIIASPAEAKASNYYSSLCGPLSQASELYTIWVNS